MAEYKVKLTAVIPKFLGNKTITECTVYEAENASNAILVAKKEITAKVGMDAEELMEYGIEVTVTDVEKL